MTEKYTLSDFRESNQRKVLIDIRNSIWTEDICSLMIENLSRSGVEFDFLIEKNITIDKLRDYSVFLVPLLTNQYSDREISAIKSYLLKGGSLLILSDYASLEDLNHFSNTFGINFTSGIVHDQTFYSENPKNPVLFLKNESPLTFGIEKIGVFGAGTFYSSYSYIIGNTSNNAWVDLDGDNVRDPDEEIGEYPIIGAMNYELGKIVFLTDQNLFTNEYIPQYDNLKLSSNIINWLSNTYLEMVPKNPEIVVIGHGETISLKYNVTNMLSHLILPTTAKAIWPDNNLEQPLGNVTINPGNQILEIDFKIDGSSPYEIGNKDVRIIFDTPLIRVAFKITVIIAPSFLNLALFYFFPGIIVAIIAVKFLRKTSKIDLDN